MPKKVLRKHRGQIMQPVESANPDPRGDEQLTWELFKNVCFGIEPLQGREVLYAQQMHGNVTHKITLRYMTGLTKRMYLAWNNRKFNLAPGLSTEESNTEIVVYATEEV